MISRIRIEQPPGGDYCVQNTCNHLVRYTSIPWISVTGFIFFQSVSLASGQKNGEHPDFTTGSLVFLALNAAHETLMDTAAHVSLCCTGTRTIHQNRFTLYFRFWRK